MNQPAHFFTLLFVAALLGGYALKVYLAGRNARHVLLHRGAVPADYADTISLEAHQKAADYTLAKTRYGLLELSFSTTLLVAWTLLGGLNWLNGTLLHALGAGMTQQLALLVCFALIGALLDLPWTLYETFVLEARFGFNKTTPQLFVSDMVKGLLLSAAIGLPVAWGVLWLMGNLGAAWWLWALGALLAFQLFMEWIAPSVLMPLFNTFTPLANPELQAKVEALMQRCGFKAKGFFVMDGSRRSAHSNAFFMGLGNQKRVVFFDTLLEKLNSGEIEAVLAHELGHFKRQHLLKRRITGALSMAVFLALLGYVSQQAWFYTGLGVQPAMQGSNDALALLLFALAVPVFTLFTTPLSAHWSRKHEFEADAYAKAQASAADLKSALLKLYQDNASTLTPDPWFVRFYYSHPSAAERLKALAA